MCQISRFLCQFHSVCLSVFSDHPTGCIIFLIHQLLLTGVMLLVMHTELFGGIVYDAADDSDHRIRLSPSLSNDGILILAHGQDVYQDSLLLKLLVQSSGYIAGYR